MKTEGAIINSLVLSAVEHQKVLNGPGDETVLSTIVSNVKS